MTRAATPPPLQPDADMLQGAAMTPEQFREALDDLGMGTSAAAALCGVDTRTAQRWASGERDIPPPVERLLWAMRRDRTLVDALIARDQGTETVAAA